MWPSIEETLSEMKAIFRLEEERQTKIESKAGILLIIHGIVISFLLDKKIDNLWHLLALISIIISLVLTLLVIKTQDYRIPHSNYEDYYQLAKLDKASFLDQVLSDYIEVGEHNHTINDNKAMVYLYGLYSTILALLFLTTSMFDFPLPTVSIEIDIIDFLYDFQIYIGTFFAVVTPLLVLKHYKQHTSLISHSSDIKKLINEIKLILNDIHLTLRVRASKFSDTSRSLHEPLFEDFFLHSPRGINLKVNWENIKESHDNFRKNQQQLLNNIKDELGNYLKEINISYFTDTIPTNHKGNCIIFQSLFEAFIVNLESKILYDKWVYDPNNIVINRTEKTISFPPSTRIGQGSLSYLNRTKDFLFQFNSTISHTIFAKEVLILNDHKVQFERRKSVFIKNLEYLLTIPILPNKCQFIPFSIPSIIRFIKSIFYKN